MCGANELGCWIKWVDLRSACLDQKYKTDHIKDQRVVQDSGPKTTFVVQDSEIKVTPC